MKHPHLLLSVAGALLFAVLGCSHLDLAPAGNPNRVLTGTVNTRMNLLPPPDAQVVVRLIVPPDTTAAPTPAAKNMVIGERGSREQPEQVIAEQVIHAPPTVPVPFRLEFQADDAELEHGLNIEARISWGRELRFRNIEAQAVTLETVNSGKPITLLVEPVK